MIVTSFYTSARYREYARRLEESAQKVGLESDICELDSLGNWRANACHIPTFIKRMMDRHGGENILFLHADCTIKSFPDVLTSPDRIFTAAAFFSTPNRPRSSTLWLRSCPESIEVLEHWERLIEERQPVEPDHVLGEVLAKRAGIRFMMLPPAYAWLEVEMRRRHGEVVPVIEHFHASEGVDR